MKGWRAACWCLILLGIPAAGRAEFDQCRLIDQVLNRLGNAMAINRLIIAEGKDSTAVAAASEALAEQNESYRRTKRQRANTPTRQSRLRWLATGLTGWLYDSLAHARQAGEALIERPWPSPSARTAEAAGFVLTDPWPGGWFVRTAALRPVAELRGPHRTAAGTATQNAGW